MAKMIAVLLTGAALGATSLGTVVLLERTPAHPVTAADLAASRAASDDAAPTGGFVVAHLDEPRQPFATSPVRLSPRAFEARRVPSVDLLRDDEVRDIARQEADRAGTDAQLGAMVDREEAAGR